MKKRVKTWKKNHQEDAKKKKKKKGKKIRDFRKKIENEPIRRINATVYMHVGPRGSCRAYLFPTYPDPTTGTMK